MPTDTPQFTHDCNACTFLGRYQFNGPLSDGNFENVTSDLYVCPDGHLSHSVITRYSDEGSQYSSMPATLIARDIDFLRISGGTHTPGLVECFDRARKHPDFAADTQRMLDFHAANRKRDQEAYDAYKAECERLRAR